ncbi:MAG: SUF system NifU family Fe-S cluster assembly protein [Gemmatimonadota bacterium]|nr:SUF system NifU family Fe-S cluster assembly protein [Gemmatimonadota bacterium]
MTDRDARPEAAATPPLHQLYQEVILDHYRRPRNKGAIAEPTHSITMNNPLCGDVIELLLEVRGGRIERAAFEGRGCSISQASASMLTERVTGRTPREALDIAARFTRMLHGDAEAAEDPALGDLRALAGVAKFPVRVKCALLPWNCLEELVDDRP